MRIIKRNFYPIFTTFFFYAESLIFRYLNKYCWLCTCLFSYIKSYNTFFYFNIFFSIFSRKLFCWFTYSKIFFLNIPSDITWLNLNPAIFLLFKNFSRWSSVKPSNYFWVLCTWFFSYIYIIICDRYTGCLPFLWYCFFLCSSLFLCRCILYCCCIFTSLCWSCNSFNCIFFVRNSCIICCIIII